MTEPPYNSDIRSDTSSGLRGLWTLLNNISAGLGSLPGILAELESINSNLVSFRTDLSVYRAEWAPILQSLNTRLGRISGTFALDPSEATGSLYEYLVRIIGPANQVSLLGQGDILDYLAFTQRVVFRIENILIRGFPDQLTPNTILLDMANVLGKLADPPAGKTIKELIADIEVLTEQIEGCVCDEEPPPNGGNPEPETLCVPADGWSAKVRCVGLEQIPNNSNSRIYGVAFLTGLNTIGLGVVNDNSPVWDLPGITAPGRVELCFSWNLTGWSGTGLRNIRTNIQESWGTGDGGTIQQTLVGLIDNVTHTLDIDRACTLQLDLDPGPLPGLDFWVSVRPANDPS